MPESLPQRSGAAYVFCWNTAELSDWTIASLRALGPLSRIVVVAPLASGLRMQAVLPAPADIIPHLVAATSGTANVLRHSIPRTYSLSPSTEALRALYPQVAERQRHAVDQAPLAPDPVGSPTAVVIDMPGYEALAFAALEQAGFLDAVESLRIRAAAEVYFDDAKGASETEARLSEAGFVLSERGEEDPDWPELCFARDLRALRLQRLEARAQADVAQRSVLEQEVATLKEIGQRTAEALAAMERDRDTALSHLESERAEVAQLRAGLDAQTRDAAQAREKSELALDNVNVTISDLKARNTDLVRRIDKGKEELRRAEGQVALIKDLLLRGPGF